MKVVLTLFFIINSIFCFSQNWSWAKSGIGAKADEGAHIATDSSGNLFATGWYSSPVLVFGNDTLLNSFGGQKFLLVKYDSVGNLLWVRANSGTNDNSAGNGVVTDKHGNAYVTGFFISPTVSFGTITLLNIGVAGTGNFFIVKYDSNGNVLWAKSGTSLSDVRGEGIAIDNTGNVFVTGNIEGQNSVSFGTYSLPPAGTNSVFLIKYDSLGNVSWGQTGGGSGYYLAYSVATDALGNAYITGSFRSSIAFGLNGLGNAGGADIYLVKYDSAGNLIWAQRAGGNAFDEAYSMTTDLCNNVYLTGYFTSTTIQFGSFTFTTVSGGSDMFLVKYNPSGTVLWAKSIGALNNSGNQYSMEGYGVATDYLGSVFVSGGFNSKVSFDSISLSPPAGLCKYCDPMFIAKYSSNGNAICATALASGGDDYNSVAVDRNGNAYIGADFLDSLFVVGADTLMLGMPKGGGSLPENIFVAKYKTKNSGSFTVSATSTAPLCNAQCSGTATALPSGCVNYSYNWSSGQNGQTAIGLCAGNYTVTVTDATGNSSTSVVHISEPTSITITTTNLSSCGGSAIGSATASASGGTPGYIYSWNTGQSSQNVTGLGGGTYTITVTDKNGCFDTTTVHILSGAVPNATISGISTICAGQSTSLSASGGIFYKWNIGDTTRIITVQPASPTTYSVIVTNANGCTATSSQTVTVNPLPVGKISGLNTICFGESCKLTVSGGSNYLWNTGDTSASITVSPSDTTTYSVTISTKGCVGADSTTTTVNVNPLPMPSITGVKSICLNQSTVLSAFGGQMYIWNTGAFTQTITVSPKVDTTYSVTVYKNGCGSDTLLFMTVNPNPVVIISGGGAIMEGKTTQLTTTSGMLSYAWTPTTGLSCVSCFNPLASPDVNTNYCVTVIDSNNCSGKACTEIDVGCGDVFVPSAFSPNSDGQNDVLYVRGKCIQSFSFLVFDRWGEKVFESENLAYGWDGKFKNQLCNSGAYTFYVKGTLYDGSSVSKMGSVILVR